MKNFTLNSWFGRYRRAVICFCLAVACSFLAAVYLFKAPFNPPLMVGVVLILGAGFCLAFNAGWKLLSDAPEGEDTSCQ